MFVPRSRFVSLAVVLNPGTVIDPMSGSRRFDYATDPKGIKSSSSHRLRPKVPETRTSSQRDGAAPICSNQFGMR